MMMYVRINALSGVSYSTALQPFAMFVFIEFGCQNKSPDNFLTIIAK
jgi:hypothetical protein